MHVRMSSASRKGISTSRVYAMSSGSRVGPLSPQMEGTPMKIKLTSVYVDEQEKALRFYTEALGFAKKADFSQGPFRWLTVTSPEDPDGTELQLALNDNSAAKAYQQAMFQQGQPAAMFNSDDVKGDYERIRAPGTEFNRGARRDHRQVERHLRQPHANHSAGAPVEIGVAASSRGALKKNCVK